MNQWINARIASSPPWTSRAIAGIVFLLAEGKITIARRSQIDDPVPPADDSLQLLALLIS